MGFLSEVFLLGSRSLKLQETLSQFRFLRQAVRRFVPGEEVDDALLAAEQLKLNGIASILTRLGENVTEETEAQEVTYHYRDVLERVHHKGLDSQISVKLTQLGLDLSRDLAYANLILILERASALGNFIWIDMEGSVYTEPTLGLFHRARSEFPNIGVCLQSYLHRTSKDLERLLPLSPAVRLVKGAYSEPGHLALQKKKDVGVNFALLARKLLQMALIDDVWPAFATHDLRLIRLIQEQAEKMGLAKEGFEYEMLYGIKREEQLRLAREGHRVRVLISYGPSWFPWYMRRLAERPANVFFVLRNILIP